MAGTDFGDERDEIIADFIVETEELVERLDQELVQMEERGDDLDLLNSIFRAAHTIKGTSSFLGFTRMTELTHKAENVLDKLRNQAFAVTPEIMDALLHALDGIKTLLDEIREGRGEDGDYDPTPAMEVLISIVENNGVVGAVGEAAPAAAPEPVPAPVEAQPVQAPEPAADSSLDDILASAPSIEPKLEMPSGGSSPAAASGGGSDLDDILASAPAIEPKLTVPGQSAPASSGGSDLDDILASAPAIEPKLTVPGGKSAESSGGSELDDILASAPAVNPKLEMPGSGKAPSSTIADAQEALRKATAKISTPSAPASQAPSAPAPASVAAPKPAAAPAPSPASQAPSSVAAASAVKKADAKSIAVEQTIRVDVERLDALMNLAGELVLSRNRLMNITRALESSQVETETVAELANVVQAVSHVAGDLQLAVMKTRMLPIGKVFNRFPRMVRDLAREKKKLV
ncbi:MAG: Hpt domain-containing protein, partial [Planctomycetes bacterium]|nr:Hpt domain-containing protein [Planctomycetota bacterium]